MKIVEKIIHQFEADDGTIFDDQHECELYDMRKRYFKSHLLCYDQDGNPIHYSQVDAVMYIHLVKDGLSPELQRDILRAYSDYCDDCGYHSPVEYDIEEGYTDFMWSDQYMAYIRIKDEYEKAKQEVEFYEKILYNDTPHDFGSRYDD